MADDSTPLRCASSVDTSKPTSLIAPSKTTWKSRACTAAEGEAEGNCVGVKDGNTDGKSDGYVDGAFEGRCDGVDEGTEEG